MSGFTESIVEEAALAGLEALGYAVLHGPDLAAAHLRVLVKRILREYGYPPDLQEKATQTVLQQAELLSGVWAAA